MSSTLWCMSMGECNSILSAYTLYRHLGWCCIHPSIYGLYIAHTVQSVNVDYDVCIDRCAKMMVSLWTVVRILRSRLVHGAVIPLQVYSVWKKTNIVICYPLLYFYYQFRDFVFYIYIYIYIYIYNTKCPSRYCYEPGVTRK